MERSRYDEYKKMRKEAWGRRVRLDDDDDDDDLRMLLDSDDDDGDSPMFGTPSQKRKKKTKSGSDGGDRAHHVVNVIGGPRWMSFVEDIRYDVQRIEGKMEELEDLHDAHLLQTFDDRSAQEQDIEILTRDITRLFTLNGQKLKAFAEPLALPPQEENMRKNIRMQLARQLQELSVEFRRKQKVYLQKLRGRQSKGDLLQLGGGGGGGTSMQDMDDSDFDDGDEMYDVGFTDAQLSVVVSREQRATQQSKEIREIVRSINELAEIMDDLAMLVVDQGSLLDRVDYNIERVEHDVREGLVELHGAHEAVKSARTKYCILALCLMIILAAIVVIFKAAIFK
jgi:syntaxin 16